MKESEISDPLPPAANATQGPRYRYFSSPPSTISLRLADIASQIPEAARLPAFNAEHSIELPCKDIFGGPAPKLFLSRLAEIASDYVRLDSASDLPIRLPAARLALGYRFSSRRELLDGSENESQASQLASPASEDFAPKFDVSKGQQGPGEGAKDIAMPECETPEEFKARLTVPAPVASSLAAAEAPSSGSTAASAPSVTTKAVDADRQGLAQAAGSNGPFSLENETTARQESAPVRESPLEGDAAPPVPETWRPISTFPVFRRKVVEPQVKASIAPLDCSKPPSSFASSEFSSGLQEPALAEAKDANPEPKSVEQPADNLALAAPVREAVFVETEHLPSSELKRTAEIPDQDALQAVFMTEEFLSVERVVELCGGLPGIKSCVLAHGSAVVAFHNVPESIDLVSLSAHALEMLSALRQSAAQMSIGAVPAVTIHSEKGPITFFHQDDLCLLVLHKDRGFVPGVREKLQEVIEHLAGANLALPLVRSRQALTQKERAF